MCLHASCTRHGCRRHRAKTLRLDHLEGLPRLLLPLLRKLAEEQMDEDNQQAAECQGAAGCDSHSSRHDKAKEAKRQRVQSQKKKRREASGSKADKTSEQEQDSESGGADKRPRSSSSGETDQKSVLPDCK